MKIVHHLRFHTAGFSQDQTRATRFMGSCSLNITSNLEPSLAQVERRIAVLN